MTNIKVNLSILLPGSTMYSVEESTRIAVNGQRAIDTHKHSKFEMDVMDRGKKSTIKVFTRKSKPAKQVIHLSEEAYNYFTSDDVPYYYKGVWRSLKTSEKLRWHCQRIAESLGGIVDAIQVLE